MAKKLIFCIGTRPEAIKLAPLYLKARELGLDAHILVSGQHADMIAPILQFFNITPTTVIQLDRKNPSLNHLTALLLEKIGEVFEKEKPDTVFVQGDTTTAFAASLAAFYFKIKVAHVEAGLRTHDNYSPFPEEMNRKMVGDLAQFHFAPTEAAKQNLIREGLRGHLEVTGNTGIDALRLVSEKLSATNQSSERKTILVTCHRRENHGEPIVQICTALSQIAKLHPEYQIIFSVHLNPNVKAPVERILGSEKNITLLPPQDYPAFVSLIKSASLILTDSGGIQEEAPYFKKPILVLRESTERPEGVEAGAAVLVGSDPERIVAGVNQILTDSSHYQKFQNAVNPYGDGFSSERILKHWL